jgi:hypothetical protein
MNQTTALTRQELTPKQWEMIGSIAPAMHASRLFGVASPEQAMAIMVRGYELGLSLTAAFEFIHVIDSKPTLSPRGALALIHQSGLLAGIEIQNDDDGCTVTMQRTSGFAFSTRFGLEDARRAGLVKAGSGWEKYPQQMAQWRAIGFCADVVFPDVLAGMKRSDEFGAEIDAAGDVVEGEVLE